MEIEIKAALIALLAGIQARDGSVIGVEMARLDGFFLCLASYDATNFFDVSHGMSGA